ncbi:MAG: DHH family phosphoesterase [Bacilli bacterium]|nr:DHH family phosphoesterase [Bacilli bacterium]
MEILKHIDELNNMIVNSTNIFIMGHRYLDLDALGGAVGIYEYIKEKGKRPVIIINDKKNEKGVKKALDAIKDEYSIKTSNKIKDKINNESLLIVVDTNKDYLLQDKELFSLFKKVIVIDHHDENKQSINKGLIIIDKDASSTCEMIADLLDNENIKINKKTATIILSGIVLDTTNYVIKTTTDTYRTSYILSLQGADPRYVQYLLKQDLKEYVERQKVITNVKQIKNVALSKGKSNIIYRREDLAKIADTLLQFDKIKASFVIGKLENGEIGISARSLGIINVGKILEKFNGGGDENEAGASIKDSTIKKVEEELKNIIKTLN